MVKLSTAEDPAQVRDQLRDTLLQVTSCSYFFYSYSYFFYSHSYF